MRSYRRAAQADNACDAVSERLPRAPRGIMKILLAYDGSDCAEAAIDDLMAAGLPPDTEAHVISVAEVWLPPPPAGVSICDYAEELRSRPQPFKAWQEHGEEIEEAEAAALAAAGRMRAMFPGWKVTSEGTYGSPAWEILESAAQHHADLIIVGSHGRSAVGRFWLGSISQKVLTEADCSVRVARGKIAVDPAPVRIVVGYDGSEGADAAIASAAARRWPAGSEARIVTVTDLPFAAAVDPSAPTINLAIADNSWLEGLTAGAAEELAAAGLTVESIHEEGSPKSAIVEQAETWGADCIFVGANRSGSRLERFLLGSVSSAVAMRAHCSVEVARKRVR